MNNDLKQKFEKIKFLALDFDGVLTDGKVYFDQDGHEMVVNSRRDSMGVGMLQKLVGIYVCIISTETNPVVAKRAEKMKVDVRQKIETSEGKLEVLKRIAEEKGFSPEQILYMGDDINDLKPLEYAGVGVTVADGHKLLKEKADYITTGKGGDHAVREVCEMILEAKGITPEV